jgi:hypothetical protein
VPDFELFDGVDPAGADDACEQMYDELIARVWSLQQLVPTMPDPSTDGMRAAIGRAAMRSVDELRRAEGDADVCRLLWPCGPPPCGSDPWWQTPLGQLVNATRRQETTAHAAPLSHPGGRPGPRR